MVILLVFFGQTFISCSLFSPMQWKMYDKTFSSSQEALDYQKEHDAKEIEEIDRMTYLGGSLMVHMPEDEALLIPPYTTGIPTEEMKQYFLEHYQIYFDSIRQSVQRTKMFDSVSLKRVKGYLNYAKTYGYRYLLVYTGTGWVTYDIVLAKEKKLEGPSGYSNLMSLLQDAVEKFNAEQQTPVAATFRTNDLTAEDKYEYIEEEQKGYIEVPGSGLDTRARLLGRIGTICSSKNITVVSGQEKLEGGAYRVLDEKINNGVFRIDFECSY